MVAYYPYALGASLLGILVLLAYSIGTDFSGALKGFSAGFKVRLARADMSIGADEFSLVLLGIGTMIWIALVLFMHSSLVVSLFYLPLALAIATIFGSYFLVFKGNRRVGKFVQQLELVLRMLSGALRVGLGLRQAIILITEEVPDPARREFMRVIGRTNIGTNIVDSLDSLSLSMPSNEMQMFAKVVRVQQQTGGDLAKVLERLAATIRERRRIVRKMGALTAQGRFGAFIIGGLPVLVGGFVMFTQHDMGDALMHTQPGWICLGIATVLEGLAIFSLTRILRFDV